VAAALSRGIDIHEFGPGVEDPCVLRLPTATRKEDRVAGEIMYADRFGNLVTNIVPDDLEGWDDLSVEVSQAVIRGIADNYLDGEGELRAVWGSNGRLEIASSEGSAARLLGVDEGTPVVLKRRAG
jgi:S-adenosylmethionine hydrolase